MKIAIIGVLDPLAQDYLHSHGDNSTGEHDYIMIDFVEPAPILEFDGKEYPVVPYTPDLLAQDIDLAICFGTESRKQMVLDLEDRKIRTIDLTGSFINEPTVPLVQPDQILRPDDLILAVPSVHLHAYGMLLKKLHQRFVTRRVAISAFAEAKPMSRFLPDKMSEAEMVLINEAIRSIDHNQVHITASIYPLIEPERVHYHIDIEFVRPFNMNGIREVLAQVEDVVLKETISKETDLTKALLIHRVKRDFSADSAIHLDLSAPNPKQRVFDNVESIIHQVSQM